MNTARHSNSNPTNAINSNNNNNKLSHRISKLHDIKTSSMKVNQKILDNNNKFRIRSRQLTWCLACLVGAIFSLMPFLSLHLNQRIGLMVFESDLIQLRSTLISVIISFIFLVAFYIVIIFSLNSRKRATITIKIQKIIRFLIYP